jgi:hypothetical protein
MHIASIGIDLGKTTFHLVALGERSKVLVRKKFSRAANRQTDHPRGLGILGDSPLLRIASRLLPSPKLPAP